LQSNNSNLIIHNTYYMSWSDQEAAAVLAAADSMAGCSQAGAAPCQCDAGPVQSTLDGGAGPIAGDGPAGRQEALGATGDGIDVASSTGAYAPTGSVCGVSDLGSAANSDGEEEACSPRAASAECPGEGSLLHNGGADPKAVIPTGCASQVRPLLLRTPLPPGGALNL
jgi:hypothetical protein